MLHIPFCTLFNKSEMDLDWMVNGQVGRWRYRRKCSRLGWPVQLAEMLLLAALDYWHIHCWPPASPPLSTNFKLLLMLWHGSMIICLFFMIGGLWRLIGLWVHFPRSKNSLPTTVTCNHAWMAIVCCPLHCQFRKTKVMYWINNAELSEAKQAYYLSLHALHLENW